MKSLSRLLKFLIQFGLICKGIYIYIYMIHRIPGKSSVIGDEGLSSSLGCFTVCWGRVRFCTQLIETKKKNIYKVK